MKIRTFLIVVGFVVICGLHVHGKERGRQVANKDRDFVLLNISGGLVAAYNGGVYIETDLGLSIWKQSVLMFSIGVGNDMRNDELFFVFKPGVRFHLGEKCKSFYLDGRFHAGILESSDGYEYGFGTELKFGHIFRIGSSLLIDLAVVGRLVSGDFNSDVGLSVSLGFNL